MKSTGIVRRIDDLNRLVIPKELIKIMSMGKRQPLEIFTDDDNGNIVLRKYMPGCVFCGNVEDTVHFKDLLMCKDCIKEVKG